MRRHLFGSVVIVALAACSSPDEKSALADATAVSSDGTAISKATSGDEKTAETTFGTSEMVDAKAVDFKDNEKSGEAQRDFAYGWPKEASAIPGLSALLTEKRDEALSAQKKEWNEAVAEFGGESCVSCTTRDYSASWKVVTDTPRFLSLSLETYLYTGGAHGNSYFGGLVWDRETDTSMEAGAMFKSDAAFWSAAKGTYCKALDTQRAKRRGRPVKSDDFGSDCPKLDDLVLLAGSSNGTTFNRLGLLAAPYVAGSYAEGPYEVTIPVTKAIRDAVKPEFREYFSAS